jgi:hypothetical protein
MSVAHQDDYGIRKRIFEDIKKFSRSEQEELYRILKRNEEEISENKNGMFFDIMNLKTTTISYIQEYIVFTQRNRQELAIREQAMVQLQTENPGITQ